MVGTMEAVLHVVADSIDMLETVLHIHQASTRNVDADWLLAKLIPNMTARLLGHGCHGFENASLSRTYCRSRFELAICAGLATLRT